jgi:alpha-tubulin suppressor-like RCC1 family protein
MEHSVILGKDGCCYVSGSNEWGQLGFPRQVENCTFFTDVISDIECIVACGHSYTVLKTNEGKYIDSGTYDSNNPQFGKYKFSPAKGMN